VESKVSIIQTLFLPGNDNPLSNTLGFLSPEFNWMSWALSCLQLEEIYGEVELYTNKAGKEVLIDQLKLPYSSVNVVLDDIDFPESLWAYPKLYTYSLQKKPFFHIDGDVFIWEKLKPRSDAKLIAQNIENTDNYYREIFRTLIKENFLFPDVIQKEIDTNQPFTSINAGIIGGSDLDFFKDYTAKAFEFITNNIQKVSLINHGKFNMIFEQYLFYCLAKQKKLKIECQISEETTDMTYKESFNFLDVPYRTKYIHMVGSYKKSVDACILLAKRLKQNYPVYYYEIINKCKSSGIIPFFNCYRDKRMPLNTLSGEYSYVQTRVNWPELYAAQNKQQALIEVTFNTLTNLNASYFQTNKQVSQSQFLEVDGSEKKIYCEAPYSYLKAFKKIECDELDNVLIKLLRQPQSFKNLCYQLQKLFNEEEMKNEKDAFIELIKLKLKNGCASNLYYIIG